MKQENCNSWKDAGDPTFNLFPIIPIVIGLLNFSIVSDKQPTSLTTDDATYKKIFDCRINPINYCLWFCDGCNEFFKDIRERLLRKSSVENIDETEVMINELGTLGKWRGES